MITRSGQHRRILTGCERRSASAEKTAENIPDDVYHSADEKQGKDETDYPSDGEKMVAEPVQTVEKPVSGAGENGQKEADNIFHQKTSLKKERTVPVLFFFSITNKKQESKKNGTGGDSNS